MVRPAVITFQGYPGSFFKAITIQDHHCSRPSLFKAISFQGHPGSFFKAIAFQGHSFARPSLGKGGYSHQAASCCSDRPRRCGSPHAGSRSRPGARVVEVGAGPRVQGVVSRVLRITVRPSIQDGLDVVLRARYGGVLSRHAGVLEELVPVVIDHTGVHFQPNTVIPDVIIHDRHM